MKKIFLLSLTILIPLLASAQKSDVRTPNNLRLDTIVWQDGTKTYTSSIAGLPVSNFLSWNSAGKYYEPYPTLTLTLDSARFYKGIAKPTGTQWVSFNGDINTRSFFYFNQNVGIGSNSFHSYAGTSSGVIGIGDWACQSVTTGSNSIGIGTSSLSSLTTGLRNIGIGPSTFASLISGNDNIAIGTQAGFSALGSGSIYLGPNAGYYETGSNKLYIANTDTANPLIYGDFSTPLLKINGTLNVTSSIETTTAGDGVILKSPNGTRYKLTVDNAGALVVTAL